jgi:diamine N-acetyltransferase
LPIIRIATRRDAGRLAEIAEQTFRATFGALNRASDMDLHCRSYYGEALQAAEIARPDGLTLLSEDEGRLIGFAQLRWATPPACVPKGSAGEINRLYVVADWHGRGVAQELMRACFAHMQRRGSEVIWLGVWERNHRALAFYRKFGFVEVGAHVFPVGTDPQRDIIVARSLADCEQSK